MPAALLLFNVVTKQMLDANKVYHTAKSFF